jgi:hypothetical protein
LVTSLICVDSCAAECLVAMPTWLELALEI